MKSFLFLLGAPILVAGCTSTVQSEQLGTSTAAGTPKSASGTAVNGVPFRIRDRLTLELYRKTEKGYELVNRQMETLADPSRLYVLNFTGQMLSDTSVKFEQLSDGSLSTVKLGDASHLPEAVTAVASGVDTLVATDKAIRTARAAEENAATADADAIVAQSQSATELTYAARVLAQQLAELPADAKTSERLALEGKVELAKMKARVAASKAGLDDPFPE